MTIAISFHALMMLALMAALPLQAQKKDTPAASDESVLYIDRMDPVRGYKTESLFGSLDKPPSRILATRGPYGHEDESKKGYGKNGLKIVCYLEPDPEKPNENPGSSAYFTSLKKGDKYLNAVKYNHLSFWVRGEVGGEKIQTALVDKQGQENGKWNDSGSIEAYTERGRIDTEWQKVKIPIDLFKVNPSELYQVLVLFDNRLYDSFKARTVTVYIDDLALE
jgi:carbohydrate binding protein with CBM30 domain